MNIGAFKQKRTWLVAVAAAAIVGLILVPTAANANSDEHKTTICHAAGKADAPANYVTITVDDSALSAHFDPHGTPQAGHELDTLGACPPPTTTVPPTTVPPTTVPPTTVPPTTPGTPTPLVVVFSVDCANGTGWLDFTSASSAGEKVRVDTTDYYLAGFGQLRVYLFALGGGRFIVGPTFGSLTGNVTFQFPPNFIAINGLGDFSVACNAAVPVEKMPRLLG